MAFTHLRAIFSYNFMIFSSFLIGLRWSLCFIYLSSRCISQSYEYRQKKQTLKNKLTIYFTAINCTAIHIHYTQRITLHYSELYGNTLCCNELYICICFLKHTTSTAYKKLEDLHFIYIGMKFKRFWIQPCYRTCLLSE